MTAFSAKTVLTTWGCQKLEDDGKRGPESLVFVGWSKHRRPIFAKNDNLQNELCDGEALSGVMRLG